MRDYIRQYSDDDIRLFAWFKGQGISLADAAAVIREFKNNGTVFESSYAFSQAVVKRAQQREIEKLLEEKIEATIEGIVTEKVAEALEKDTIWQSILKLWRRVASGLIRFLNSISV